MRNAILLVLLFMVLVPAMVFSQIPRTMSYQGVLTDDLGNPKPNGRYFFTFNLYDVGTGGVTIWTQAESLTVTRGLFTTTLGQTPFGAGVLFNKPYWLGIQVGTGAQLAPRVKLSAAGYSINADTARVAGTVADNSVTSAKIANGTILFADMAQNGAATGQVMKWSGSSWVAGNDTVGSGGTSQWTTLASDIYYNGGNVGIGAATAPAYRLDVLHGGATGIRSRSSGTFSVVDIDAFNGDAALRFQKAGVNQWNLRNRPADNYLEIFELGGGGSRLVIQDSTGNLGVGETVSPAYKLDVLHGGNNGAHIKSATGSAAYSTVDIDADNGDASVRFQKAGVNSWSMRNRPSDDYLEFVDLTGGANSRMVMQKSTGNVGIGETTSPSYKLDVLHGGAAGLRVRSSASFSAIDIDGFTGDAALRFYKVGVGQWNIRNNPATDDLQFFELGGGERMRIENTTGNVAVVGTLSKGAGSFKIDHPLDPENKYLYHSFVESPDMMNIYNGNTVTDGSGKALVSLPDYFEALNMDFRYQLTVIGTFAQAIVSKKVQNNQFEIATNQPGIEVSWQVTGIRHDAFADKNRIPREVDKEAVNRGKYLHPAAFNVPASRGIGYVEQAEGANAVSSVAPTSPVAQRTPDAAARSGGSLDPVKVNKTVAKPADNTGSVVDTRATKR